MCIGNIVLKAIVLPAKDDVSDVFSLKNDVRDDVFFSKPSLAFSIHYWINQQYCKLSIQIAKYHSLLFENVYLNMPKINPGALPCPAGLLWEGVKIFKNQLSIDTLYTS